VLLKPQLIIAVNDGSSPLTGLKRWKVKNVVEMKNPYPV
jgi:hypothetical protein